MSQQGLISVHRLGNCKDERRNLNALLTSQRPGTPMTVEEEDDALTR